MEPSLSIMEDMCGGAVLGVEQGPLESLTHGRGRSCDALIYVTVHGEKVASQLENPGHETESNASKPVEAFDDDRVHELDEADLHLEPVSIYHDSEA